MTWLLPAAVLVACAVLYLRERRQRERRRSGKRPTSNAWFV